MSGWAESILLFRYKPNNTVDLSMTYSLEAKHLIWVWIMKVKGPKNQVDFIEVLYVVVNGWGATF